MGSMKIHFFTNLDEAKADVRRELSTWPTDIVPRVGERVRFPIQGPGRKVFDLEVVAVTYDATGIAVEADVELHIPSYLHKSIKEWSEWLERHRSGA